MTSYTPYQSSIRMDSTHASPAVRRTDVPATSTLDGQLENELNTTPRDLSGLTVALVHDFFYVAGGAERVVEQIINAFPQCDVFGLFDFLPDDQRGFLKGKPVQTSFLQSIPGVRKYHRSFLPLMPLAIEQIDVSDYDLVISSSYAVAKGVLTGPDQLHVCYCHSPVRFAWDQHHQYMKEAGIGFGPIGLMKRAILHLLRNWDVRSSFGVDHFIANSDFIRRRIQKTYRRDAVVIHPPVDTESFCPAELSDSDLAISHSPLATSYYLTASRLVSQKRIDVIVDAFTRTPNRKLVVVGDGPKRSQLEKAAGDNVTFVGSVDHGSLVKWMQGAKAFVFASEEDFGIVPVEAMACGVPVIAYGKGGVTESVIDRKTGILFPQQTADSLREAVDRFETSPPLDDQDRVIIRQQAERFSAEQFAAQLTSFIAHQANTKWPDRPSSTSSQQPKQQLATSN